MHMNKAASRQQPGDQGQPFCQGCKQRLKFGTDMNGGTIQWCQCGTFELATIRLPAVAVKSHRGSTDDRDCLRYMHRGR